MNAEVGGIYMLMVSESSTPLTVITPVLLSMENPPDRKREGRWGRGKREGEERGGGGRGRRKGREGRREDDHKFITVM